jgi:hypothetical protein
MVIRPYKELMCREIYLKTSFSYKPKMDLKALAQCLLPLEQFLPNLEFVELNLLV